VRKTLTPAQRSLLATAVGTFEEQLGAEVAAQGYLLGRGVDEAAARTFRLGFVGADAPHGFRQFRGRLAIPYLTPAGPVDIRFRCIRCAGRCEGHPKYAGRAGVTPDLFNVAALHRESNVLAICEGEFDALTLDRLVPTVGVPGAQLWQPFHARLMEDYDRVLILADPDEAGDKLADRIRGQVEQAEVIRLPDGDDVNSVWVREGLAGLQRLILRDPFAM